MYFITGETGVRPLSVFSFCGATIWLKNYLIALPNLLLKGFVSLHVETYKLNKVSFVSDLEVNQTGKTMWGQVRGTQYICATLDLCFSSYPEVKVH